MKMFIYNYKHMYDGQNAISIILLATTTAYPTILISSAVAMSNILRRMIVGGVEAATKDEDRLLSYRGTVIRGKRCTCTAVRNISAAD